MWKCFCENRLFHYFFFYFKNRHLQKPASCMMSQSHSQTSFVFEEPNSVAAQAQHLWCLMSRKKNTIHCVGEENRNLFRSWNPHAAPADIQDKSVSFLWRMFVSLSCWAGGCYVALWWDKSLSSLMRLWRRWQHRVSILDCGKLSHVSCLYTGVAAAVLRALLHRCTFRLNARLVHLECFSVFFRCRK